MLTKVAAATLIILHKTRFDLGYLIANEKDFQADSALYVFLAINLFSNELSRCTSSIGIGWN